ncbi:MAG: cytochrome P450 [Nostoc sp. LLA-1]|nr:cytochrome P450 [Cyanocohniella sp. LLY]
MTSLPEINLKIDSSNQTLKHRLSQSIKFNPFDIAFHINPYPTYHNLRILNPVYRSTLNAWILTRYVDVKSVLRDPRFCVINLANKMKDKRYYLGQQKDLDMLTQVTSKWLIFVEAPEHTRLRKLVGKAFSPITVEQLRPYVQMIVDELIDQVIDKGVMDVISDLATPLPVTIIAKLMGVPDEDCLLLHKWSDELSHIIDPLLSVKTYENLNQVVSNFTDYFYNLFITKQKNPQDDLISHLLVVQEQNDKLSREELLSTCILLFAAGEETTINTIGNGILALLHHPEQMEKLRKEPKMIVSAVEELLRYDSPVQHAQRIATEDVNIGGQLIRTGDKVIACLGAANRDPSQFSNPDQLDITRRDNPHLAFIEGIHACLGASLARLNTQTAINTLLQRLPNLSLTTDKLEWRKNIALRGLKSLPVSFNL